MIWFRLSLLIQERICSQWMRDTLSQISHTVHVFSQERSLITISQHSLAQKREFLEKNSLTINTISRNFWLDVTKKLNVTNVAKATCKGTVSQLGRLQSL